MKRILFEGKSPLNKSGKEALGITPYIPSPNLVNAVKISQILQRPLLVKGEPGCGKSKLAEAVAIELHKEAFRDYYFEWNVKSTSKAIDGLYSINNLQRLSDANLSGSKTRDLQVRLAQTKGVYQSKGNYVELGELGKAFAMTQQAGLEAPPVVLIDEIDKADIDFPNDLLLELDRMEFSIPEARDNRGKPVVIRANKEKRPVCIITSNDEKPLPAAFLRRCVFYYIDFSEIRLEEIVAARYRDLPSGLGKMAVEKFKEWRTKIENAGVANKNISTSELLDWVSVIRFYHGKKKPDTLEDTDGKPVYASSLLKDIETIKLFTAKKT